MLELMGHVKIIEGKLMLIVNSVEDMMILLLTTKLFSIFMLMLIMICI